MDKAKAVAKVAGQIFSMLFLEDKNVLIVGTMSGGLHVIDMAGRNETLNIYHHKQSIFDIRYHSIFIKNLYCF